MGELSGAQSLGFTLPSTAYIVGAILFGIIGFVAFRYGKKLGLPVVKWVGVVLMFYPYAIAETWQLYTVGIVLCAAMVWFRDWRDD